MLPILDNTITSLLANLKGILSKKAENTKDLVFIVEDNPVQQAVLKAHFEEVLDNYAVRTFLNPIDLIESLKERPFAVVLDHFYGPEMETGLYYLKKLRKTNPTTPIIYHTSLNDNVVRNEVMALGAEIYIVKDEASLVRLRSTLDALHLKLLPKKGLFTRLYDDYVVNI